MRSLAPPDLSFAINDLCKRYSVNLAALSAQAMMDWEDLAKLAADPLVTIGSATVNYPVLSNLKDADALREMTMGRAVAQAAFHRDVRHFAYPFGDRAAFARQACADGRASRICQRGVGDPGHRSGRGPQPICTRCRASPGTAGGVRCAIMRVLLSGADLRAGGADAEKISECR